MGRRTHRRRGLNPVLLSNRVVPVKFVSPPAFRHGTPAKTAVLLVNLGTPEAPTAPAVRRYLKQFLSDPRVVEIPAALWQPILRGIILNVRPKKSAAKYAAIWTKDGSPLKVHTDKQAKLLRGYLGERGLAVEVEYAMRYGEPSIESVLKRLTEGGVERVLILPLYPQYSATTTASVLDCATGWLRRLRNQPELRWVKHFHDDAGYLDALAESVRAHWEQNGRSERLVLSFHGVPKRTLLLGDPYHCECLKTGRLLRERLGLDEEQCVVTFQSRFGRAEWLQPYTEPTLRALAKSGVRHVDVLCPGFVSDCLETLEEIALEGKQAFLSAGGSVFHYVPCLNDRPRWMAALADLAVRHLAGWDATRPASPEDKAAADALLEAGRQRALQAGAKR
jgi:ferrochelatase